MSLVLSEPLDKSRVLQSWSKRRGLFATHDPGLSILRKGQRRLNRHTEAPLRKGQLNQHTRGKKTPGGAGTGGTGTRYPVFI